MKRGILSKGAAWGVLFCFILSNPVLAVNVGTAPSVPNAKPTIAQDLTEFSVPRSWGRIKEIYEGTSGKFVVHIQDAHCNYEAQEKIGKIVDRLATNYGVNVVGLEGGAGRINTFVLSTYPNAEVRRLVADYLLRNNEITGAEYTTAISNTPPKVYGIENMQSYLDNLSAFNILENNKKHILGYFSRVKDMLAQLKGHIYNEALLDQDKKREDYSAGKMSFNDYCAYLSANLEKNKINKEEWLTFTTLMEAVELEKKIDFTQAENDKKRLIAGLTKSLPKEELKVLVDKTVAFKNDHISSAAYCAYLKDVALENNVAYDGFNNFDAYIEYATLYERIENGRLFDEIEAIEESLRTALFKTDQERALSKLYKQLAILEKMVTLKMINKDMAYYTANKADFTDKAFVEFINRIAPQYGLNLDTGNMSLIDENLGQWEKFYQAAAKRDNALIDNTLGLLEKENVKAVAMVVGGFHTKALTEIMRQKDISYIVVTPHITKNVKSEYIDILKGKKTILDEFNTAVDTISAIVKSMPAEALPADLQAVTLPGGRTVGEMLQTAQVNVGEVTLAVAAQIEGKGIEQVTADFVNALRQSPEYAANKDAVDGFIARLQGAAKNITATALTAPETNKPLGIIQLTNATNPDDVKTVYVDIAEDKGEVSVTDDKAVVDAKIARLSEGQEPTQPAIGKGTSLDKASALLAQSNPIGQKVSNAIIEGVKERVEGTYGKLTADEEQQLAPLKTQIADENYMPGNIAIAAVSSPKLQAYLALDVLQQSGLNTFNGEAQHAEDYLLGAQDVAGKKKVADRTLALDRELIASTNSVTNGQIGLFHEALAAVFGEGSYKAHQELVNAPVTQGLFNEGELTEFKTLARTVINNKVLTTIATEAQPAAAEAITGLAGKEANLSTTVRVTGDMIDNNNPLKPVVDNIATKLGVAPANVNLTYIAGQHGEGKTEIVTALDTKVKANGERQQTVELNVRPVQKAAAELKVVDLTPSGAENKTFKSINAIAKDALKSSLQPGQLDLMSRTSIVAAAANKMVLGEKVSPEYVGSNIQQLGYEAKPETIDSVMAEAIIVADAAKELSNVRTLVIHSDVFVTYNDAKGSEVGVKPTSLFTPALFQVLHDGGKKLQLAVDPSLQNAEGHPLSGAELLSKIGIDPGLFEIPFDGHSYDRELNAANLKTVAEARYGTGAVSYIMPSNWGVALVEAGVPNNLVVTFDTSKGILLLDNILTKAMHAAITGTPADAVEREGYINTLQQLNITIDGKEMGREQLGDIVDKRLETITNDQEVIDVFKQKIIYMQA